MGSNQGEWRNSGICVQLVLLARDTALDVFVHELHKTWPPELHSNELMGLEIPWVASGFVIMTVGKDRTVEGVLQGNIDTTFVCKNMIVKLPVGEP